MKSSKNIFKKALWASLLCFVAYTFYFLWSQSQPEPEVYEIIKPDKRTIQRICVATGDLEARNQVELKPQVNGIITTINVRPGQTVKVGDVVAIVKVIPDMNALNKAQGDVNASTVEYNEKEREFNRIEALFSKGVVSREEYDQTKARYDAAREALATAKAQIEVITKGASARSGNVNTTQIVSTMNGTVLSVPVKVGSAVSATSMFSQGTTVAKVADMHDIIFNGNIDETEVANLRMGMGMTLISSSMQNIKIAATLEYIAPEGVIKDGTKMFEIHASANIPAGVQVLNGYSVNAEIEIDRADGVISVNEACVEMTDGKACVYVLTSSADNTKKQEFKCVPVTLGISDGVYVEIKKGIDSSMLLRGIQKN